VYKIQLNGDVYAYVDVDVFSKFTHKRFLKSYIIKVKSYMTILN